MQKIKTWRQKVGVGLAVFGLGMMGAGVTTRAQTLSTNDFMPQQVPVQQNPGALVTNIVDLVFVIAAALTFCFLVYGSIQWITAGGDSSKIEAARKNLIGAIIGLLILASTWAIFSLVMQIAFKNEGDVRVPTLLEGGSGGNNTQTNTGSGTEAYTCGVAGKTQPGTCPTGQVCRQHAANAYSCQSPAGESV